MSKSPSLRRIQADIRELAIDPSDQYYAAPLESDLFEWHFTIKGAKGTDFDGGIYHGRILLPAEYPFKAPHIMFLTPSGRFETNTKICLSFTAFHNELWQPAWGIRLILEALISFLPTKGDGAIGALDWKPEERKRLAKRSLDYVCPICGNCSLIMKNVTDRIERTNKNSGDMSTPNAADQRGSKFHAEIEKLHVLQVAAERIREEKESNKDEKDSGIDQFDTLYVGTTCESESFTEEIHDNHENQILIRNESRDNNLSTLERTLEDLPPSHQTKTDEGVMAGGDLIHSTGTESQDFFNDVLQDPTNLISDSTANYIISALVFVIAALLWGIANVLNDLRNLEEKFRNT